MPAIIGGIATLGAAAIGAMGQSDTNEANVNAAAQASQEQRYFNMMMMREQMQYGYEMSSTAYQRAVYDMQKAGLNPMLAYQQGGAASPGASAASSSPVVPVIGNKIAAGMAAAGQAASVQSLFASADKTRAETDRIDVEKELIKAQTQREYASAGQSKAETDRIRTDLDYLSRSLDDRVKRAGYESVREWYASLEKKFQAGIASSEDMESARYFAARAKELTAKAELAKLEIPRGLAEAAFFRSEAGKFSSFTSTPSRFLSSASEAAYEGIRRVGEGFRWPR